MGGNGKEGAQDACRPCKDRGQTKRHHREKDRKNDHDDCADGGRIEQPEGAKKERQNKPRELALGCGDEGVWILHGCPILLLHA